MELTHCIDENPCQGSRKSGMHKNIAKVPQDITSWFCIDDGNCMKHSFFRLYDGTNGIYTAFLNHKAVIK